MATTGGTPVNTSAGRVKKLPPPATAFKAPATKAATNSKDQFANSPDLADALMNAIMDAFEAHTTMSSQALGSERVREGLKDTLLGPAQLYEALRARAQMAPSRPVG